MELRNLVFCALFLIFASGCTHALHQYHVSEHYIPNEKYEVTRISAEAIEKNHIFKYSTSHADKAFLMLQKECKGIITGINTRHSTSHGFFGWKDKVKMTAYCLMEKAEPEKTEEDSKDDNSASSGSNKAD